MEVILKKPISLRIKQGLVAYWPLADDAAIDLNARLYGPTVPTVFTNSGTATRDSGPSNNLRSAAAFARASSQFLTVADSNILSLGGKGAFSGCGWYYGAEAAGANVYSLAGHYETTGNQRAWWVRQTATAFSYLTSVDGTNAVTVSDATTTVVGTTWYFVYWYFDASRGKAGLRINLAAVTEGNQTGIINSTGAVTIGARGAGADLINGRIAHVGLWNRLLTDQEHFWLYNNGQGRDLTRGC